MTDCSRGLRSSEPTRILGIPVHPTSYREATRFVLRLVESGGTGFICHANVHMVMEGHDSSDFRKNLEQATLITPDGMPLVWMMRLLGQAGQNRVYGPGLMLKLCEAGAKRRIPIGLFGATDDVLDKLTLNLKERFPSLDITYRHAPPFGPLSPEDNVLIARDIEASGAKIVFVALGCPKQEKWMAEVTAHVPAVLLGVGAAFDFFGGNLRQAPAWMQQGGLEWLFRFFMEPRRLFYRYLKHNPRFLFLAACDVLRERVTSLRTWRQPPRGF